jgi:hypothetical protein
VQRVVSESQHTCAAIASGCCSTCAVNIDCCILSHIVMALCLYAATFLGCFADPAAAALIDT